MGFNYHGSNHGSKLYTHMLRGRYWCVVGQPECDDDHEHNIPEPPAPRHACVENGPNKTVANWWICDYWWIFGGASTALAGSQLWNTKSIIFNTKFIIFNTKSIILIQNRTLHHLFIIKSTFVNRNSSCFNRKSSIFNRNASPASSYPIW